MLLLARTFLGKIHAHIIMKYITVNYMLVEEDMVLKHKI